SELHALLSDHNYILEKDRAPATPNTSSFATKCASGSPSITEPCQAQFLELDAKSSGLGFQVSPIAPSSSQASYGARPSNNNSSNNMRNNNNHRNHNNSRGNNNNNRGRGNGRQFDRASTQNTVCGT
ncbi:hypothetical protein Tco_0301266, partial [Tanacetum coccineum]